MSTLTFTSYEMPSASLGKLNPLPDLRKVADQHAYIPVDKNTITEEESRYMGWGRVNGILPYLLQDGYDRKKKPRAWKAAVLENDYLKATFLPELGGRLWSLIDKTTKRELLHRNPVFQPCNLALRNAWISGGVEWNIGIIGHSPFTVDKMFSESLELEDGTPVLRLFQYERVRRLVFKIEAMLPKNSQYLFIRVKIDNATDADTAVYWWSNIAVDEREDVRVLVPSDKSYRWGYGGNLSKVNIPYMTVEANKLRGGAGRTGTLNWDMSYTTQLPQAMDFFFDIPKGDRPWISAVGADGYGLVQTSTDNLQGRKLFVWGMSPGGRNWQAFLSKPGYAYIELQAGLARTQLEHLPMKGNDSISWMEAYGPVKTDAKIVHGKDWDAAYNAIHVALEENCPRDLVKNMHLKAKAELDGRQGKIEDLGDGWAIVENKLLKDRFNDGNLNFPVESIGDAEKPWIQLIEDGALPCPNVLDEPNSYQIGDEWETILKESIDNGASKHWYGYYQYGVILAYAGKMQEAEEAFDMSLKCEVSPWALRNKALLRSMAEDENGAIESWVKAANMLPERNIVKEAIESLNKAGMSQEAVDLYERLPQEVKEWGRLKVLLIEALLNIEDIARAESMLDEDIELTDVREGEVKLTDLWFKMMAMKTAKETGDIVDDALIDRIKREHTPPLHLDFRMH